MNVKKMAFLWLLLCPVAAYTQELNASQGQKINADDLPKYIIISSQKGEIFNDIAIIIDSDNSPYKKGLDKLEHMLQNRKMLKVRNQADLLNAMDQLGFDYLDVYQDTEKDSKTSLDKTARRFRVNMIFKKKEKYGQAAER